mmetsp:Transcript_9412/g.28097  ORF Transcript_9412/g.28097 Transcript_9412/m.28097 type:complete len:228 (+) Transcript_9412:2889-3572(+)
MFNCPSAKSASSPFNSSRRLAWICFPTADEDTAGDSAASSSSSIARLVAALHKSPKSGTINWLSSETVLIVSTAVSKAWRAAGPNFRAAAKSFGDMVVEDDDMNAIGEDPELCQKSEATVEAMDSWAAAASFDATKRLKASSAVLTYWILSNTSLSTATFFLEDTRFARTSVAASSNFAWVVSGFSVTTIKDGEPVMIPSLSFRMRSMAGPKLSNNPSPLARSSSSA